MPLNSFAYVISRLAPLLTLHLRRTCDKNISLFMQCMVVQAGARPTVPSSCLAVAVPSPPQTLFWPAARARLGSPAAMMDDGKRFLNFAL